VKTAARKFLVALVIAALTTLEAPGSARAGMVSTEEGAASERRHIVAVIDRADVRARLEAQGVDPDQAKARVALLGDAQAARLAADLEHAPAGGHPIEVLLYLAFFGAVVLVAGVAWLVKNIGESIARSR
jgi:hypothetical protein